MFKSFFNKHTMEDVAIKIADVSTQGDSPLEKWLYDLKDKNIAELYMYHFAYGWLYIHDNDLVQLNDQNIRHYFVRAYNAISQLAPDIDLEFFCQIFTDRFQRFREELSKTRKSQYSTIRHFPGYFYGRILDYPLMDNDFDSDTCSGNGGWNEIELADMSPHQINHIQNHLDNAFK